MNLSEDDMERLADLVADKLQERFYADVGKRVVKKFIWLVGFAVVAGWLWVQHGAWWKV